MKIKLVLCLVLAMVIMSSCGGGERNYYHNKNGRIKHVKARKYAPWHQPDAGSGYDNYSRHSLQLWDRNMR